MSEWVRRWLNSQPLSQALTDFFFFTGNRVLPGRVYKFEGWTKLLDRKRTGDIHSLELWLRYKKRGDKEQKNKLLAKRTKYSQGKYE